MNIELVQNDGAKVSQLLRSTRESSAEVAHAISEGVRGWDDLRPEVRAMALFMECELRKNEHKGGLEERFHA